MTPLHMVGTVDRKDLGVTFAVASWHSRECYYKHQKLTTGINYQSFFLSSQFALTSLCYMQVVSIPLLQL